MAAMITQDCQPDERHLVGMWVAPERRGSAVATQLVEAVCQAAAADGAAGVVLWVADDNVRAERFYRRVGFVETGERQPLPSNPAVGEQRMRRAL
jgi:ribosomal protein S18 acetylase RimI-like enzyme